MNKPHFHFITLFPETIQSWLTTSIIGRAHKKGLFDFTTYQLRDFSESKHGTVDDTAYGGGGGMVLKVEPLAKATESIFSKYGKENCRVIYFSPAGKVINSDLIDHYSIEFKSKHLIFICGHYEGIDQRFTDHWVDEEISIGDFVVSGGELPALLFSDALIRHLDGTLAHEDGAKKESFHLKNDEKPLLEYAHYTKPAEFKGLKVPDVLLGGNHQKIEEWRLMDAKKRTAEKRPDLL